MERKLDALHTLMTTALSLLQSQGSSAYASAAAPPPPPVGAGPRKPRGKPANPSPQVFDARAAMLAELKQRIKARRKAADAAPQ